MAAAVASAEVLSKRSFVNARKIVARELCILRGMKPVAFDAEEELMLDLIETAEEESILPLALTIQIGSAVASRNGLSERTWMQELLERYAGEPELLDSVWRVLLDIRVNEGWAWPSSNVVPITGAN